MLQLEWDEDEDSYEEYPTSDGKPVGETDIHRDLLLDQVVLLQHHYRDCPDVYVTGNLLWFYREGDGRRHVSPDVMICFGVPKGKRLHYLQWREGTPPQGVIELTSRSTRGVDLGKKLRLYEELGVEEYYVFDPPLDEALDAPKVLARLRKRPRLQSFFRVDGRFVPGEVARTGDKVTPLHGPDLRAYSPRLGLELLVLDGELRMRDPSTGELLLKPDGRADAAERWANRESQRADEQSQRADEESQRAEQASQRAELEARRAERAEQELAELRRRLGPSDT